MINWFNMPDEGVNNGGLFEVKELEVTENGTYETKGEMYNKVTVNVEGGGGSSDFSTLTVTVDNESDEEIILTFIPVPTVEHIIQEEGISAAELEPNGLMTSGDDDIGADANSTEVYKFLLAKDSNFALTRGGDAEVPNNITVSGNAEKSYFIEQGQNHGCIIVTGDCTITLSPRK